MCKIDHGQDNWTIVKYCSSTAQSNFFLSPRIWPMWKNVFYWTIFISQEVEWHPTVTSQQQQRASLYRYGLSNIFIKVRTPNIWSFSVFLSISLNLNCRSQTSTSFGCDWSFIPYLKRSIYLLLNFLLCIAAWLTEVQQKNRAEEYTMEV